MKTQQAAEREEQQRIKNLVLNYDLRDGEEQDGDNAQVPILLNLNIHNDSGNDKAAAANFARPDKSSNNRSGQRARKLQLSDVDWYGSNNSHSVSVKQIHSQKSENRGHASAAPESPASASPASRANLSSAGLARLTNRPPPNRPLLASANQKTTSPAGRVTKKAMLAEHASRKVNDGKK